jgi:hypothetical protein
MAVSQNLHVQQKKTCTCCAITTFSPNRSTHNQTLLIVPVLTSTFPLYPLGWLALSHHYSTIFHYFLMTSRL